MLFNVFPFSNSFIAKAENTEDCFTYEIIEDEAVITGFDKSITGDLEIPATLGGYPVTRIDNYVFYGCDLTNISIPDSVISIGYFAFNKTKYYRDESNWDGEVLYIDNHLIEVRTSVSGEYKIKEGTKSIADFAFYDCDAITSIIIPEGVKSIGNCAFEDCYSIESISIPNSVKIVGDWAFLACASLKSVEIPNSVLSIGDFAFQYCDSLETVTLGENVEVIGNSAFQYCEKLKNITIPASVIKIDDFAFQYCNALQFIEVSENNEYYSSVNGVLFNKDKSNLIQYPAGLENLLYRVPDSVTIINSYAFQYSNNLQEVIVGDNVKSIGHRAFYACESLKSVMIGEGITIIENATFSNCTALEKIYIPKSVKSIGDSAFSYCTSLASITLPSSVTKIGGYAFLECTALTNIKIPETVTDIGYSAFKNTKYYNDEKNWENGFLYIGEYLVNTKTTINGKCSIKDGTKYIADSAFYSRTLITEITIPSSVVYIGKTAFYGCNALEKVNFCGSEEEWSNILIGNNNKPLTDAEITFNFIELLLGDVNQDNAIDICDMVQLKETLILDIAVFPENFDINEDGDFNSLDLTFMRKILFEGL